MSHTTRVVRVRRILQRFYPYRIEDRKIRRVCAVIPETRHRYREAQDRFIAAVVVLPSKLRDERGTVLDYRR